MPDLWMDVDAALTEVPINKVQLIDDTDFKSREEGVTFDQAGLDLVWKYTTTAGVTTMTPVTPTNTGGDYDFVNQGDAFYTIEMPASGGASINNDTEGFGQFIGFATGILPWIGPIIGFRDAALNNALIDDAYSATRGLTGTAVPDAAADAPGGLPISDAGGLPMDGLATEAKQDTAQADLDTITDVDGVVIGAAGIAAVSIDVWDVLESAVLQAGSMGLKLKNTLPVRLTKNAANANFHFLMVDSADHITPKTGLTVTATRVIDAGSFSAATNSVVEIASGMYRLNQSASDLNGDNITFLFTAAGADDRLVTFITQPGAV